MKVLIKFNDVEPTGDEDNVEPNNVEDDEEDEADNAEDELDGYEVLDLVLTSLLTEFTFCWIFYTYMINVVLISYVPLIVFYFCAYQCFPVSRLKRTVKYLCRHNLVSFFTISIMFFCLSLYFWHKN